MPGIEAVFAPADYYLVKPFSPSELVARVKSHIHIHNLLLESQEGMDSMGDTATVTVHINRLRDKLSKNTKKTQFIETVWGAGYRFRLN